jgi:hypothetical protein
VFGQIVRATLGGGEDNGLVHRNVAQQMVKQAKFVTSVIGIQQRLCDVGVAI